MLIVTTDFVSGKNLETLSFVKGSTIQSVHLGKDILSSLKTLVGGELSNYTKMMENARNLALNRMIQEAESLGADAIISVRFATSNIMQSAAEVMAYGTAVKFSE